MPRRRRCKRNPFQTTLRLPKPLIDHEHHSSQERHVDLQVARTEAIVTGTSPGPPFRLLDLPPELRNSIFEYASWMQGHWAVCIDPEHNEACHDPIGFPALLQTSRQVHNEARCLMEEWFKRTDFHYHYQADLICWLSSLQVDRRMQVRSIQHDGGCQESYYEAKLHMLSTLNTLRAHGVEPRRGGFVHRYWIKGEEEGRRTFVFRSDMPCIFTATIHGRRDSSASGGSRTDADEEDEAGATGAVVKSRFSWGRLMRFCGC